MNDTFYDTLSDKECDIFLVFFVTHCTKNTKSTNADECMHYCIRVNQCMFV